MLSQKRIISVLGYFGHKENEKNVPQFFQVFVSAVCLPHGQFWTIIKGTVSSPDVGNQEFHNKVGSLSLAGHLPIP